MANTRPDQAEIDAVLNRVNLALARSQRIVQSWLPAKAEETDGKDSQDDPDREDVELLAHTSELLGVGAVPAETTTNRSRGMGNSAHDKLKRQLLSRNKQQSKTDTDRPAPQRPSAIQQGRGKNPGDPESDDEEDMSRTAVFKSKTKRKIEGLSHRDTVSDSRSPPPDDTRGQVRSAKKRNASFLDEMLSEKAKKKSKGRGKTATES